MLLGWRDVPVDNSRPRRAGEEDRAGDPPGVHRPRRRASPSPTRSSASSTSSARASGHAIQALKLAHGKEFYVPSMSARTIVYKGMLLADQVGRVLQGPAGPARRVGARAGAPALLDQHLPDVGPRASVPHDRPQRRDQHGARQRQLDPRAPGRDLEPDPRRRPRQDLAADLRRPVRLGLVRQRARAAGDGRLLARARGDDDDPRGVGEPHADGRAAGARSTSTTRR